MAPFSRARTFPRQAGARRLALPSKQPHTYLLGRPGPPTAASGINTLTVDSRGHGESGGTREYVSQKWQADVETAFQFLISQPGVQRDVIGVGGPGSDGVIHAVETASLHPNDVKSLVLMSGETFRPGIEFLHQASQLPELFVVADTDEYPPISACAARQFTPHEAVP